MNLNVSNSVMPELQLIKPPEAAKLLAVSERTLWTLTKSGRLPAVLVGQTKRYRLADLEKFVSVMTTGGNGHA